MSKLSPLSNTTRACFLAAMQILLASIQVSCAQDALPVKAGNEEQKTTIRSLSSDSSVAMDPAGANASQASLSASPASLQLKVGDKGSFKVQLVTDGNSINDVTSSLELSVDHPEILTVGVKKDDTGAQVIEAQALKVGSAIVHLTYGKISGTVAVEISAAASTENAQTLANSAFDQLGSGPNVSPAAASSSSPAAAEPNSPVSGPTSPSPAPTPGSPTTPAPTAPSPTAPVPAAPAPAPNPSSPSPAAPSPSAPANSSTLSLVIDGSGVQTGCVDKPITIYKVSTNNVKTDVTTQAAISSLDPAIAAIKTVNGKPTLHPRMPGNATIVASFDGLQTSLGIKVDEPAANRGWVNVSGLTPVAAISFTHQRVRFEAKMVNLPRGEGIQSLIPKTDSWSPDLRNFAWLNQGVAAVFNEASCLNEIPLTMELNFPYYNYSLIYTNQTLQAGMSMKDGTPYTGIIPVTFISGAPSPLPENYVFSLSVNGSGTIY